MNQTKIKLNIYEKKKLKWLKKELRKAQFYYFRGYWDEEETISLKRAIERFKDEISIMEQNKNNEKRN